MSLHKERSFEERWNRAESLEERGLVKHTDSLEKDFYAGRIRYRDVIGSLEKVSYIDEQAEKRRLSIFNFFKGMAKQEEINMDAVRFKVLLSRVADAKKKDYGELTRAEVQEAYEQYEKKEELENNEKEALQLYEDCLEGWEDTAYIEEKDVQNLVLDIEYRRAKRIKDPKERKEALEKIKERYREITDGMVDNSGKRAEIQFVGIVNEWAERQGTDHLVDAHSAMPLDDHKEKVDIEIVVGGKILNISLKAFHSSKYSTEFSEELLENERGKISGSSAEIAVLDHEDVQAAWRLLKEKPSSVYEKGVVTNLMRSVIGSVKDGELLRGLAKRKKPKRTEKTGITRKQLVQKHSNIPNLKRWGYLTDETATDVEAIMTAKRRLQEDLEDKKVFAKLRADI